MSWLASNGPQTAKAIKSAGYRNAASVLIRLGLIQKMDQGNYVLTESAYSGDSCELLWSAAASNEVVGQVVDYLQERPNASNLDIAEYMRVTMEQEWKEASKRRVGTGLWQWATWVLMGREQQAVPPMPKGRPKNRSNPDEAPGLFNCDTN
jgi:hypothetical protein